METDHKPLEMIMLKPLQSTYTDVAAKLQKYSVKVKYKKGEHYLADTLSRAHWTEVHV